MNERPKEQNTWGATVAFAAAEPAVPAERSIETERTWLMESIGELDTAIDKLEQRMHMVLKPGTPVAGMGGGGGGSTAGTSPMFDEIAVMRQRVSGLSSRVASIASRLDL